MMNIRTTIVLMFAVSAVVCSQIVHSVGSGTAREIILELAATATGEARIQRLGREPAPAYRATVRQSRSVTGLPVRQRNPELSVGQFVIIGMDQAGREIDRMYIRDPRVIRSESVSPTGQLSSELIYQAQVEFPVVFADDPAIRRLRIYQPRWTGAEFLLDLIAESTLP